MPRPLAKLIPCVLLSSLIASSPGLAQADRFAADSRLDNQADAFGVSSRKAAHMCVAAAEEAATRAQFSGVEVIGLKTIERKPQGFEMEGWIRVSGGGPSWRESTPARGTFECEIARGRIVDLEFDGIPGL